MAKELDLVSVVYKDEMTARAILEELDIKHDDDSIELADAALVRKDESGKIHITESRELTGWKGVRRGAVVAGIFGLVFPPSLIASAVAGGLVGGAWGRLRDTGIKRDAMQEIGERLNGQNAAVVALTEPLSVGEVQRIMQQYEGQPTLYSFSAEETEQIEQAAESSSPADT